MNRTYRERVARFYDVTQAGYDFAVSRDYLRYGLWDDATRTAGESLVNTDRFVGDLLRLGREDVILDAGCGVGGSAVYFARTYGARVVGVNICTSQLEKARRKAERAGLADLVRFEARDFCATGLPDAAFTKLYAIESVYHAESSEGFVREAFRLLAPGGRLAVVDRFLLRDEMSQAEIRLYDRFRAGQVVAGLPTLTGFRRTLQSAGFSDVQFTDQLHAIQKGIARTQRMCVLSYPLSLALTAMRLLPRELHGQTAGLMAIRRLFAQGVVTYGGFVAEKPSG
ncbi:MAG: methyltransferase domain-containing protein [Thermoguttaceae bacterium]|jgi:tocopherol O-methyltransferase